MVTIVDFKPLKNEEDEDYFGLVVQGGLEPVTSQESGKVYFTARTTTVPCTFNEQMCKTLIGKEIPGHVIKAKVEPYDYNVPGSDEVIELTHRYQFISEEEHVVKSNVVQKQEVF